MKNLQDMSMSDCHWPLWNNRQRPTMQFCGQATDGESSYCYFHHQKAYVGRPKALPRVPRQ